MLQHNKDLGQLVMPYALIIEETSAEFLRLRIQRRLMEPVATPLGLCRIDGDATKTVGKPTR